MKKNFVLLVKKVSIITLKIISVVVGSIGGASLVLFLIFMVYLLITETHNWMLIIPDSTRLFGLGWMNVSAGLVIFGAVGFIEFDKRLKKLKR